MTRQNRLFIVVLIATCCIIGLFDQFMRSESPRIVYAKHGVNLYNAKSEEIRMQNASFGGNIHDSADQWSRAYNTQLTASENNWQSVTQFPEFSSARPIPLLDSSEKPTTQGIPYETANAMGYMRKDVKKFAVVSTSTDNHMAFAFSFYIPLTVLAWKRIGYGTIVLIAGSKQDWQSHPRLSWVLSNALEKGAFCVFLPAANETQTLISQVSRIFAANIINSTAPHVQDSYLVLSDVDLWPLQRDAYDLPPGKTILSLNSECCGSFTHRGKQYKMLPMGNIGMSGRLWQKITQKYNITADTVEDIIMFVLKEFGNKTHLSIRKRKPGWYQDQHLVSILIQEWGNNTANHNQIQYSSRSASVDRMDRRRWSPSKVDGKIDAHLPVYEDPPKVWAKLEPLLSFMYGENSTDMQWCIRYYEMVSSFKCSD